jgi:hypothetical protein
MLEVNDVRKARWLFTGLLAFLLGGCMSWEELMYLLRGRDTRATITKVFETHERRGTALSVEYTFAEPGGGPRRGNHTVSLDWPVPRDKKVTVRYTPGEDGDSRLAGHVRWSGLLTFFGALLLAVVGAIVLGREAHDDKPRKNR